MRTSRPLVIRHATALALSVCAATAMVSAATKGPDAGGYTASDAAVYSLVDISGPGGGASVLAGIDDGVVPLTLPFTFQFYGRPYTTVCASANGAVYFVAAASACSGFADFANTDLTSTATPNDFPALLPFWSDLTFQIPGAGAVFYQTIGAAGSRRFVMQWSNAYPQGSPNPVTFQVVLSEGTNKILFQYQSVGLGPANPATNGGLATVGIRNSGAPTNNQQLEWSFAAPVLGDGSALQFSLAARSTADVNGDGVVNCADLAIVNASFGKRSGQAGFDARADVNGDRIVNLVDLATVSRALPAGTKCP
jgi:Dockerin type I domain